MNERIKMVRLAQIPKLSQEAFGARIGVTGAAISRIESGDRSITEQVITAICREFQVDEHWLRTGEGQMQRPMSRNDELARFLGEAIKGPDEFKRTLLTVMSRMTTEEWAMLERKAWELVEEMKKAGPR